jgi:hypothetical protein
MWAGYLFGGTAACFDSGASRGEEGASGAYDGENSGGVFRGGDAAVLGVQREDSAEKSEADEQKAELLHWCISVWEGTRTVNGRRANNCFCLYHPEEYGWVQSFAIAENEPCV